MSLLWFCVLLLVASVCGNPPRVINLGTRFIPRFHNQYSDLVARILRNRGIRVYSVHDVGALTSTTLNRRFSGFGGDSSLGLENTFVRSSPAGGRPTVTYEELYGGVDTSDLPAAAVPLVGSTLGTRRYGPGSDGPGLYDLGPNVGPGPYGPRGDGPGPYGPGEGGPGTDGPGLYDLTPNVGPGPYGPRQNGPGDGSGIYDLETDVGPGPYGPRLDGLGSDGPGPYGPGDGSGLSGFGPAGVETVGFGLATAGLGEDRLYDESSINGYDGLRGTGLGDFGSLDDGFSVSAGSRVTRGSTVYPRANYGPFSTGGRSSVYSSYQSTYPTYSDLYKRRFSSVELGAGGGVGGALGTGFSTSSSFVDSLPYSDLSSAGAGFDYGVDGPSGGLGYLRSFKRSYNLPGYSSVQRRTRYFPRRKFTTRVYNYPPTVTTYQ
uniref:Spider flagelliform silk-like protein Shelk1 n=1 Tax=Crassostrea nippona TaxID=2602933 RepID=L0N0D2_CRANI|nr:spider flagelliform silk-like protein Shelk1 [Crassostrea nippona]